MLLQTECSIDGCRIWLESNDKRTAKSSALALKRHLKQLNEFNQLIAIQSLDLTKGQNP